jgi:hypothetical protein
MSQAKVPLTFIFVSVVPHVDSVAFSLGVYPLADIALFIGALPDSITLLDTLEPLTIINFAIFPLINALAMGFSLIILPVVDVAVRKDFIAAAMAFIVSPLTFIDTTVVVHKDSLSITLFRVSVQLASIETIFVLFYSKAL